MEGLRLQILIETILLIIFIRLRSGLTAEYMRDGCKFDTHSGKCIIFVTFVAIYFENWADNAKRSVLAIK